MRGWVIRRRLMRFPFTCLLQELKTKKNLNCYPWKCPRTLTGMSAFENVQIQSVYGSSNRVLCFVIIRPVCLWEFLWRELPLYKPYSFFYTLTGTSEPPSHQATKILNSYCIWWAIELFFALPLRLKISGCILWAYYWTIRWQPSSSILSNKVNPSLSLFLPFETSEVCGVLLCSWKHVTAATIPNCSVKLSYKPKWWQF